MPDQTTSAIDAVAVPKGGALDVVERLISAASAAIERERSALEDPAGGVLGVVVEVELSGDGQVFAAAAHVERRVVDVRADHAEWLAWKPHRQATVATYRDHPETRPQYEAAVLAEVPEGLHRPHLRLALMLLEFGEYELGFALAAFTEWFYRPTSFQGRPRWGGERLDGRTLLVRIDPSDGLGDCLQFWRYIPLLAERYGARVILEAHPGLERLARGIGGVVDVWVSGRRGDGVPSFDAFTYLSCLASALGTSRDTIPPAAYLPAAPMRSDHGRELRVGLVWGASVWGRPARDVPLAELAPLGGVPGVRFLGLQKSVGHQATPDWQRRRAGPEDEPDPPGLHVERLAPKLHDLADTAREIESLDLVISVDTAVAHLTGALGRPCWVLLPAQADWRWELDRDRSPWYPDARLFRQDQPGDWAPVVQRVAGELRRLVAERGTGR